jgi:Cro/C1-type HTH DNA-binding domain
VNLAEVSGPTEVSVSFWNPTATQRWAWLLVRAVPAGSVAVALWLLAALTAICEALGCQPGDVLSLRD